MEDLFNNKKEFTVGMRVFSCIFNVIENKNKKEDDILNEKYNNSNNSYNYKKKENKTNSNDKLVDYVEQFDQSESDKEVADKNLKLYLFNEDINIKIGTIRFIGTLKNQSNSDSHHMNKTYFGIEWDNKIDGKNFGNYGDKFYFFPVHFLKKEKIKTAFGEVGAIYVNAYDKSLFENLFTEEVTTDDIKQLKNLSNSNNNTISNSNNNAISNSNNNTISNSNNNTISNSNNNNNNNNNAISNSNNNNNNNNNNNAISNSNIKPCSFLPINNIHIGITFTQALHFRYNYFSELDLSIEDYQTKKVKKVVFSGEQKVQKHFKNFSQLSFITLNKYLIYKCDITNNLIFNNLISLSLCCNLLTEWSDIFKIINIANKLSYLNLSKNKLKKLSIHDIFICNLFSKNNDITEFEDDREKKKNFVFNHKLNKNNEIFQQNNNYTKNKKSNLIFFKQIKELCLDETLITWEDVILLSFIFPCLETLSLKKNYITNIKLKNQYTNSNSSVSTYSAIIKTYMINKEYNTLFDFYINDKNCTTSVLTKMEKQNSTILPNIEKVKENKNDSYNNSYNDSYNDSNNDSYNDSNKVLNFQATKRLDCKINGDTDLQAPQSSSLDNTFSKEVEQENINPFDKKENTLYNCSTVQSDVKNVMDISQHAHTDSCTYTFYEQLDNCNNCIGNYVNKNLFKKLKKIVLNDNYLYDYEELFYFIYKIKSIQSIFLNNNKYEDNNNLIDIVYNICIEEDNYKKNKEVNNPTNEEKFNTDKVMSDGLLQHKHLCSNTEIDKFELINTHFNHLKEFLFNNNKIKKYETLRDLFYILYDIEILKLQNKKNNNYNEKKNLRYIFIAILPKLKVLNHSCVNKTERINLERFFISAYNRDPIAKIFNQVVLNRTHSSRLEKIHYEAMQCEKDTEKKNCMQSNLINITIIPEFINTKKLNIIKKKVNRNMNIKDLKYLCSRLYSIPIPKMQLFYTDENNPMSVEIVDTNSTLYTYGIDNNSKIKIKMEE
ncbi:cytoskeleton associated protein, putative [Hepatocystis sp. ex Piliocolobus tephrosceles]|nr:cytoskeleton associated protein, putative [Hepatocystis sp. ex Piliocolobus tephrosceles]